MSRSFEEAKEVLKVFFIHHYDAYIVGGAVRDHLLGKPVNDIDIATSARPEQVQAMFKTTIPVGIKHGTVIVRYNHTNYEVTTFRKESGYDDFRRPAKVTFETSLLSDLKRRDFTINAMALTIDSDIIDPYNGRCDIEQAILQTVNDPYDRFREDPLRMMRGIRFISQLGFKMPPKQLDAIRDLAHLLKNISIERLLQEFSKLLAGKSLDQAMPVLVETSCHHYLPGLETKSHDLFTAGKFDFNRIKADWERWCALVIILDIPDDKAFCRSWKMSNKQASFVVTHSYGYHLMKGQRWTSERLYEWGLDSVLAINRLISVLSPEASTETNLEIEKMWRNLPIKDKKDLNVNGQDLMAWTKQKPGPWLAGALKLIEGLILNGQLKNERKDIKEWVMACLKPKIGF
ncbi:CCA tRNA nucleotidyltransferase [Scopulibacillus darangshiensis]|nr:CCA tRNA nucleotidyltransferase [Scopulibacillus darangshiensis]